MTPSADRSLLVLCVSGAIGFSLGLVFSIWQDAVEPAQVLAGLVRYQSESPFFIYQVKLWTLIHQVCAVLLWSGLSEITVSKIVSGLLGLLSFQALALFTYAISRNATVAIGSVLVIFVSRAAEVGVVYPIFLLGVPFTYGVVGLSYVVLVASLIGTGWYRAGGFLLGLAPAVHPSLGIWFGAVAVVCVAWDFLRSGRDLRAGLSWFLAGCVVTVASFALHVLMQPSLPEVDPEMAARYLTTFVASWDGHRSPVNFNMEGVALNVRALVMAAIWLLWFARDLPRPAIFLLRFVAVSAVVALGVAFLSQIPPARLPPTLLILMPSRWLNIDAMVSSALLFGLLGAYARRIVAHVVLVALSATLLLLDRSRLWESGMVNWIGGPLGFRNLVVLLTVAGAGGIGAALLARFRSPTAETPGGQGLDVRVAAAVLGSVWIMAGVLSCLVAYQQGGIDGLRGAPSDSRVFAMAAVGRGMLLTGGELHLIQLRTRRPVLLDGGGLDGLPYALESAPLFDRVLRDVYGVDLFDPPEEALGHGVVPPKANREIWQRYSLDDWRRIRRTFRVTQVLTQSGWDLDLPAVIRGENVLLYDIPE